MLGVTAGFGLGFLELGAYLLDFLLEKLVLVGEGGDFLLLGEVVFFELFDFELEFFDLGLGLVGFEAEGVEALEKKKRGVIVVS